MPFKKSFSICFINQTLGIGGAETFNAGLLDWFQKQGITVKAYTTNIRFADTLKQKNINVHIIPIIVDIIGNWKGFIKGVVLFPFAYQKYKAIINNCSKNEIILMTGFIEKIFVTAFAKKKNLRVIWIEFAPLQTIFTKFFGVPKLLYHISKKYTDLIISPTHYSAHANNFPDEVIACAVEDTNKKNSNYDKNCVCCVSRLEPGKGQDVLLKSWVSVVKQMPNARLKIIGEGAQYKYLQQLIEDLHISSSVCLTGWVENARAQISDSAICIFPSTWSLEGFGLTMIEAMSESKPVIAFSTGPVGEILNNDIGILLDNNNENALAKSIIHLLQHPDTAKKLGLRARVEYKSKYTFEKIGRQYLDRLNLIQ